MVLDRREFIKIAGLAALGMSARLPGNLVFASGPPKVTTGTRWAMAIDVKKCLDNNVFDACITACHTYYNVPDIGNRKEEVKWIWTESFEHAFHDQEHHYIPDGMKNRNVLVLCNQCDNPPCVRVCPTGATFKRADGIVIMDMHRCIGCRYCVAACPYGSRSFNWRDPHPFIAEQNPEFPTRTKGVVEKCNFCAPRLARGLQPACVEACHEDELIFGNINDPHSKIRTVLQERFSVRRKPSLGTQPEIYYLV